MPSPRLKRADDAVALNVGGTKIRLDRRFRAAVADLRAGLRGDVVALFDFICAAGELGWRLPDGKIDLQAASGRKDPRRRLAREFAHLRNRKPKGGWHLAGERLRALLLEKLAKPELSERDRGLRILLAYVTIALAPDNSVPTDPLPRAAWDTASVVFTKLFPSKVARVGTVPSVQKVLAKLHRETRAGLKIGRLASGSTPGPAGRALAVDARFIGAVGLALGRRFAPGYMARYLYYAKSGDHIWPHPDDPKFAVTVLTCISHTLPRTAQKRSAFLAYNRDGSVNRYELSPGETLAVEPGCIHAREPVIEGEQVALLSIGLIRA